MNKHFRWAPLLGACALAASSLGSQAALVTVPGTHFDLTYDTTQLGLFGAPTLSGDSLFFSLSPFNVSSVNGAGVFTQNSTIAGLVLTARSGYQFASFSLSESGSYMVSGAYSEVVLTGKLQAFNTAASLSTQTAASLGIAPNTPLTLNDGVSHDWSAAARIDSTTAPVSNLFSAARNVIGSNPNAVGLSITNGLEAYTEDPQSNAFIEKRPSLGVRLDVVALAPVPVPPALALLGAGLACLAGLRLQSRRA